MQATIPPSVLTLEDITPNFNHPDWKTSTPKPGTLVAFTTRVSLNLTTMHGDAITLDAPRFDMIFIARINDNGTSFSARVCEPNLARSITVARSSGDPWLTYWRRMIVNAWHIGTRLEEYPARPIFHYLASDYGMTYTYS